VTNAAMIADAALPKFLAGKIRRLDRCPERTPDVEANLVQ
jgi:hypothetical protein